MSSFIKLKSSDKILSPYVANKSWNFTINDTSSNDYIKIYKGQSITSSFDIRNESLVNGEYPRFIYNVINQLYYQDYTASLNTSSLANSLYYESASEQRNTSSYFNYNTDPAFISNFPSSSSSIIRVLSISQSIFGSRIQPTTFVMSSSLFYVTDDGKGNIFDTGYCGLYEIGLSEGTDTYYYTTCSGINIEEELTESVIRSIDSGYSITSLSGYPYYNLISNLNTSSIHIGNIFYEQGIITITNPSYSNMFPTPIISPPTSSINFYGIFAPSSNSSASGTGSIFYKIDTGPYILIGNLVGDTSMNPCISFGSITASLGSTIYIGVTSSSLNVNFGITNIPCSSSFLVPYCGINTPYSTSISGSLDITVVLSFKSSGIGLNTC